MIAFKNKRPLLQTGHCVISDYDATWLEDVLQQAADAAGAAGLYILVAGNNTVAPYVTATAQSVPKDTLVAVGTTVQLEFTDTRTGP